MLEIRELVSQKVAMKGNKKEIVKFVCKNFPIYKVGEESTLESLAYVIEPKYKLYRNNKEVYSF